MNTMKDHTWLAVFSVFTLVVGALFTYGNGVHAQPEAQPFQVYVVSTTTPSITVAPQPVTITLPAITITPPAITVNVSIATSSLPGTEQVSATPSSSSNTAGSSYTYYVTNNSYSTSQTDTTDEATEATTTQVSDTVTLSIQGVYEATTTPITSGQTALELLTELNSNNPALALTTQDYGDMGVLVATMGGLVNGTDGNYWQYMVNGVSPMVGADQYELEAGDAIVWEFKGF